MNSVIGIFQEFYQNFKAPCSPMYWRKLSPSNFEDPPPMFPPCSQHLWVSHWYSDLIAHITKTRSALRDQYIYIYIILYLYIYMQICIYIYYIYIYIYIIFIYIYIYIYIFIKILLNHYYYYYYSSYYYYCYYYYFIF